MQKEMVLKSCYNCNVRVRTGSTIRVHRTGLNQVTVKLARHVLTNREVAIKVIDKKTMNQTSLNKLFREVRIMKLLHHPNVGKYIPNHRTHNQTTNSRVIFQSNYSKLLKLIEHFIWLWSTQMAERFLIIWWRMVE